MDFPIKNGGSFHCYVSSPEGNHDDIQCHSMMFCGSPTYKSFPAPGAIAAAGRQAGGP